MSEEKSFIPALTLEPNAAQTEAAVEEAPVEEKQAEQTPVEKLDISSLSPAEQAAVRDFSEKIDIKNTDQIMNYGSAAQKNISEFSDAALSSVKTKDLGECGDMLSELVVELKGLNFDEEEKKGFLGLFKKASQTIAEKKAQFDKAEVNVDKIVEELAGEKIDIVKYSDDPHEFVAEALSPAKVVAVEIESNEPKVCKVSVPESQLSLAIGNKGQNVRLAAKLTGWKIDIRPESGYYGEEEPKKEAETDAE